MKLLHTADLHFARKHLEVYKAVQEQLFFKLKEVAAEEEVLVVVAGDILDVWREVPVDVVSFVQLFFLRLLEYADVIVVPGNHDFDQRAEASGRDDVLGRILLPLVRARRSAAHQLFYWRKTGLYEARGLHFAVCSLMDSPQFISHAECVRTLHNKGIEHPQDILCIFHGMLREAIPEHAESTMGAFGRARLRSIADFDGYSAVLMGDLHRHRDWKNMSYCGSPVQLRFGESNCHGVLLWDVDSIGKKQCIREFFELRNPCEKLVLHTSRDSPEQLAAKIDAVRSPCVELRISYHSKEELDAIHQHFIARNIHIRHQSLFRLALNQDTPHGTVQDTPHGTVQDTPHGTVQDNRGIRKLVESTLEAAQESFFLNMEGLPDGVRGAELLQMHRNYLSRLSRPHEPVDFKVRELSLQGFLSYRDKARIPLQEGILVLHGTNGSGKSSVAKAFAACFSHISNAALEQTLRPLIHARSNELRVVAICTVASSSEEPRTLRAVRSFARTGEKSHWLASGLPRALPSPELLEVLCGGLGRSFERNIEAILIEALSLGLLEKCKKGASDDLAEQERAVRILELECAKAKGKLELLQEMKAMHQATQEQHVAVLEERVRMAEQSRELLATYRMCLSGKSPNLQRHCFHAFFQLLTRDIHYILDGVLPYTFRGLQEASGRTRLVFEGEAGPISFSSLSGFESAICTIALQCALKKHALVSKPDVLFVDDVTQCIDDENIGKFATVLRKATQYYATVVLATHHPSLQQIGDHTLFICKNKSGSHIKNCH